MQDGNNVLINIERTAANGGELPDNLELPEQLLFLTLRELYSNYKAGAVERERAKREKQRILSAYKALKISYEITNEHEKIRKRLEQNMVELHNCDCPHCRKLYLNTDGTPKLFKLSELEANGTNIGLKPSEWKATISQAHPRCRCLLQYFEDIPNTKIEDFEFDESKSRYILKEDVIKDENRKVQRKSKVKITIGEKEFEV